MPNLKTVTIIGAGLGGLTSGALLAQDGYKVTLLEQHNVVGGCATTFKRKGGFICEVGLHEMDGVFTNPKIKKIFDKLDVYNNVEFVKPDEFFSVVTKNGTFIMPDDVQEAQDKLTEKFPNEQKGIEKYFKLIGKISKELEILQSASWYHYLLFPLLFSNILRYKNKTVTEVLDKIIEDDELKLILNTNVQYYNDTPDTLSFLLHSVAQYSYYSGGGWFIKGGSQKLSDYFAKVITDNGGEIITKANVIECDSSHVTYLRKKEKITIHTDVIISNLSLEQTYKLFYEEYIETKETADSLLTIYIGFSKNLKEVYGKKSYSNFIFDEIDSVNDYNTMLKKDITERGFVFVDYSQVDSALTKDASKSFGVICLSDFIEEWQDLSEDDYNIKKQNLQDKALSKLEVYYPNIKTLVEYIEVGTSKTVNRYIKTPNGTAYGYKPTPKQFFKIPKVRSDKINNLYFVGQWVVAGGFSPAISSGEMCYDAISKRG
jgi:phytoene dehydrogenase-like protein